MYKEYEKKLIEKFTKSLAFLQRDLNGIRTGRANINLLEPVLVNIYGNRVPISQLATLSTPDARTISIHVWDKSMVKSIVKAIAEANLGLTPISDQQLIRITIPILSEERRKELVQIIYRYGSNYKVTLRNLRREAIDFLKKSKNDNLISKDDLYYFSEEVQKLTDKFSVKIDSYVLDKEKEILLK